MPDDGLAWQGWCNMSLQLRRALVVTGLVVAAVVGVGRISPVPAGADGGDPTAGKTLVWADEFNGTTLDTSTWNTCNRNDDKNWAAGRDCWAQNYGVEACYSPSNVTIANGVARLRASATAITCTDGQAFDYAIGYLGSEPIPAYGHTGFTFRYGYAEVRMTVPAGAGLFPAFWLKPHYTAWPTPADPFEIDTFEFHGDTPGIAEMGLRMGEWGSETICKTFAVPASGTSFAGAFHTYGVDWQPTGLTFFLDGVAVKTCTPQEIAIPDIASFLMIQWQLETGVLGHAPLSASTPLPADADVDYVRVYQALTAPPAAPTGLGATNQGPNVSVTWADASSDETGFEVQRARYNPEDQTWGEWAFFTRPVNATSFTDTPGQSGQYAYLVRSVNGGGQSAWAIAVVQHSSFAGVPPQPTNLAATSNGANVNLAWSDVGAGEIWYDVLRARYNPTTQTWGEWVTWATDRDHVSRTDTNAPDGQYAYLVRATNQNGSSDWAITTAVHSTATTAPVSPSSIQLVRIGSNVTLGWSDSANNELFYEVQRATFDPGTQTYGSWVSWVLDKNSTSLSDTGAPTGKLAYLVRAVNPIGASDWTIITTR